MWHVAACSKGGCRRVWGTWNQRGEEEVDGEVGEVRGWGRKNIVSRRERRERERERERARARERTHAAAEPDARATARARARTNTRTHTHTLTHTNAITQAPISRDAHAYQGCAVSKLCREA